MVGQMPVASTARWVERGLIAVAGALLAACPYLTWVRVVVLGGFDLPGLLTVAGSSPILAYLVTGVGVAVALTAVLVGRVLLVRMLSIAVALIGLLAGGPVVYDLASSATASHGLAEVGGGLVLGVVGAILTLVAPVAGFVKDRSADGSHALGRCIPWWFPAALGTCIVAGLLLYPVRASEANYCGLPLASWLRPDQPLPSQTPPASVEAALKSDRASVAEAQRAFAAEEQRNAGVQAEVSSADALQNQAQAAEQQAQGAADTVSTDQSTVDGDQSDVDDANWTVEGDQSTVDSDQSTIQSDESSIASDQQSGWDPSFDEQELANDQATLTGDQQTLQKDQAAAQAAQSKLDQDSATLARDQQAADAANRNSTALQQQADQASSTASQDGGTASQQHDQAAQEVDDAESQLADDQDNWSQQYQDELAYTKLVNVHLATCRSRSETRLVIAAIALVLSLVTAGVVLSLRRLPPLPRPLRDSLPYQPGLQTAPKLVDAVHPPRADLDGT